MILKTSLSYKFPKIYNISIVLADNATAKKKYLYLAEIIGGNKKVFEIGCGTVLLAGYLKQSCSYIGWDLNKNFVDHCCKKGLEVFQKDIFDFDNYPDNDVIVISDVLHHIVPCDRMLIKEAKKEQKSLLLQSQE